MFWDSNVKFTVRVTNTHTGMYLWGKNDTTFNISSYDNDKIIDTDGDHRETETDNNHKYVEILEFGLEKTPNLSYTNKWD